TPDGRYVAFVSEASNLVAGDSNGIADVFVRDLQTGTTTLASPGATGTGLYNPSSEFPEITPDGRFVAFYSTATNVVPGSIVRGDIYVRDLVTGTTAWASTGARDALLSVLGTSNAVSYDHAISADGQYVIYQSSLAPNSNINGTNGGGIVLRYNL